MVNSKNSRTKIAVIKQSFKVPVLTLLATALVLLQSGCSAPYLEYRNTGAVVVEEKTVYQTKEEQPSEQQTVPQDDTFGVDTGQDPINLADIKVQKIGLMLPFSSPYGRAAQAYEDGFMQAYQEDTQLLRPTIVRYDIGEGGPRLTNNYQLAKNQQIDVLVGPLGTRAANAFLQNNDVDIPVLAVANLEPTDSEREYIFGISLAPENEARQIADYAYYQGLRSASIIRPETDYGLRVFRAFSERWNTLGGRINAVSSYASATSDYGNVIRQALGANDSPSYRDDDSGFLLLIADVESARIIVPQVRFYHGQNIRIFATSSTFSAAYAPQLDGDLEGVIFPDLLWTVNNLEAQAKGLQPPHSVHFGTALDRFYVLGYESYRFIGGLPLNPPIRNNYFSGEHMTFYLDQDGNLVPQLVFAQFNNGVPRLLITPEF